MKLQKLKGASTSPLPANLPYPYQKRSVYNQIREEAEDRNIYDFQSGGDESTLDYEVKTDRYDNGRAKTAPPVASNLDRVGFGKSVNTSRHSPVQQRESKHDSPVNNRFFVQSANLSEFDKKRINSAPSYSLPPRLAPREGSTSEFTPESDNNFSGFPSNNNFLTLSTDGFELYEVPKENILNEGEQIK